jgi:hypothetical protein
MSLTNSGHPSDGNAWFSEFNRLVPQPVGTPFKQALWHVVRGNALMRGDDLLAAYEAFLTACDVAARDVPEYTAPFWMAIVVGSFLESPRRYDEVLAFLESVTQESDQVEHLAVSYSLLSLGRVAQGDWESARAAQDRLRTHLRPDRPNQATPPFHAMEAEFALREGDLPAARKSLEAMRRTLEYEPTWSINTAVLEARIELRDAKVSAALKSLESGLEGIDPQQILDAVVAVARALAESGEVTTAASLIGALEEYNRRWGIRVFPPWVLPDLEEVRAAVKGVEPDGPVFRLEVEHREEARRLLLEAVRRALANLDG